MKKWIPIASGLLVGFIAATISFADFSASSKTVASTSNTKSDAEKVYVPLGQKDDYYLIDSGGHSGQLFVYGVPSMREIRTIPVFSPDPATGYGFDARTKKMLGGYSWGDLHHPALSETNGDYDGKFLFAFQRPQIKNG
jgi:nitrous-oxide reductase